MDLQTFLQQREIRIQNQPRQRELCTACRQPHFTCFCKYVAPFETQTKFVILIHHLEFRRRIATGRLAHLCLKNSELIRGYNYSEDVRVNTLLSDKRYHSVILYPGPSSVNLTGLKSEERSRISPEGAPLQIFVIDGTWNTARKMLRHSVNLHPLPRICFTPTQPSRFRVRLQPKEFCYSTVEAIHHTLELLECGPEQPPDSIKSAPHNHSKLNIHRPHDNLLHVFDKMVEQQLDFIEQAHKVRSHSRHRSE